MEYLVNWKEVHVIYNGGRKLQRIFSAYRFYGTVWSRFVLFMVHTVTVQQGDVAKHKLWFPKELYTSEIRGAPMKRPVSDLCIANVKKYYDICI